MNLINGFLTITAGQSLAITADEGWSLATIKNNASSTGVVTISGSVTRTIGGRTCNNITLVAGEDFSFGDKNDVITNITIACAAGTTAKIAVQAYQSVITIPLS